MKTSAKIFKVETEEELQEQIKGLSRDDLLPILFAMRSEVEGLKQALFKKSERRQEQMPGKSLFDEVEVISEIEELSPSSAFAEPEEDKSTGNPPAKPRGKRNPLPKNLPRERVEHDLSDEEKICPKHQTLMDKIGENITEQLEFIPASMKVIENVTFSYKCPCCSNEDTGDKIVRSQCAPQAIPKSMATATLLAQIATSKFQDALPLYRQEKIFARHGIQMNRTTMARWMIQVADLAQPLINLINDDLLANKVIGCDETPLQVLDEPNRHPQQKSYMWVTCSMDGPPAVLFNYYQGRSAKVAADLLSQFEGTIVCDGLKSYDAFANEREVQLAGCMAHIRRKFYAAEKMVKRADPKAIPRAKLPLDLIRDLYKLEKTLKDKPPNEVLEARQEISKPLMSKLKDWLDDHQNRVLPKSLLGKAINYAIDQWPKMQPFLNNPLVPIDNNRTERCIRPFVIGRGNWMFSQTPKGAHASATIYSLIESAKANGIEPFSYLSLIFKELPNVIDIDGYEKLLPYNVQNHFSLNTTQPPQ
jgi:transposase